MGISAAEASSFVQNVFDQIVYQKDDVVAAETLEKVLHENFYAQLNGEQIARDDFIAFILDARTRETYTLIECEHLLTALGDKTLLPAVGHKHEYAVESKTHAKQPYRVHSITIVCLEVTSAGQIQLRTLSEVTKASRA